MKVPRNEVLEAKWFVRKGGSRDAVNSEIAMPSIFFPYPKVHTPQMLLVLLWRALNSTEFSARYSSYRNDLTAANV